MVQNDNQSLIDYSLSAHRASKVVTETFSSSFGSAITLFDTAIRQDIYNIYGFVRVADEIVDTYQGTDAKQLLDSFESETYEALKRGFSANIIIQAFIETASRYQIDKQLIAPFFISMRMDLSRISFDQKTYDQYIFGSAEVVGLMCLKVFTLGENAAYNELSAGAKALGAGFQKVNFLRDMGDDYTVRGRYYFPKGSFTTFNDDLKNEILADIQSDFNTAKHYVDTLPKSARSATRLAYSYYEALLNELSQQSAADITSQRTSVGSYKKLKLLLRAKLLSYGS